MIMIDIVLIKATRYQLSGDNNTWYISIGEGEYTQLTTADLTHLHDMIETVLPHTK